ncbi:glycosyltransferase [Lactiplantibacillus fabifermentans]|uniref:Lipopolysaccharide biosynthesis glycosyltransferase n=2 Tax=Lactiplantibacillus fabifermentans TaxID=483011 RepID=A0A0R2NMR9_9LACO|nr:glycosyltransferase [Lactiplantibacillus fabifermentans]ETY74418.1 glycosyl transferase [Lactiplantibacillus fabifermentans T30PCM01]KRO26997.1 lipopolysaccharide biosynthesis glycosyltransferase [Lactiplantibacillus fabifermentans DSM 21115]
MNILYCGDINSQQGLLISILALRRQTTRPLHIYVLTATMPGLTTPTAAIPVTTMAYLNQLVKQTCDRSWVNRLDITALVAKNTPTANLATIFTPACMLRLYADQVPSLPDKLLYLDTDVLARRPIDGFYDQSIENYEIAGVLDHYGQWLFHQHWPHPDYLNSGVLLLNMSRLRETHLLARCRQLCQQQKMFMPDQSALNRLATAKLIVPRKYNEQRRLHRNTVFQHFTTSFRMLPWLHTLTVKPWQVEAMHTKLKCHAYDQLLTEYQQLVINL